MLYILYNRVMTNGVCCVYYTNIIILSGPCRMRVIQMTTDGGVRAGENNEKPRDPDRTRDLFGVQLEVIQKRREEFLPQRQYLYVYIYISLFLSFLRRR